MTTSADKKPSMTAFDAHHPPSKANYRELRPLRLLPARLSHIRALERRDGLPARTHLPDEARQRGQRLDESAVGQPFRFLPRLHGCMTACPSGVDYGKLIEATRAQIERHHPRSLGEKLHRRFLFSVFARPEPLAAASVAVACLPEIRIAIACSRNRTFEAFSEAGCNPWKP